MDIGIIELRNLDYAVAAYKYYKTSSENLTKLSLEDINGDMSEIRDIIYNYESDFINEKLEKGEVFYFDKEFFLDNINSISVDYANPHYIGYD